MNLSHRFIDAPVRTKSTPSLYEFLFCVLILHSDTNVIAFSKVSKLFETLIFTNQVLIKLDDDSSFYGYSFYLKKYIYEPLKAYTF